VSNLARVIVLAEDKRHQAFIRHYLYQAGLAGHDIRFHALPRNRGCAEQYVRENYAANVKDLSQRAARAAKALVVAIDADQETVARRQQQLESQLKKAGLPKRPPGEPIVHLIPKRNIETWILHLTDNPNIDEATDYRNDRRVEPAIRPAAEKLFDMARNSSPDPNLLPSLAAALPELRRLPELNRLPT
jgi:hypothetical protein